MPQTKKIKKASKEVKEVSEKKVVSSKKNPGFASKIKNIRPQNFSPKSILNYRPSKTAFIILIAIGLLVLASYKKNWFIAATVNNTPVSNIELQERLNRTYREQTLTQMINEKILLNEANKNDINISDADINDKVKEVETKVGGAQTLDSLLSSQGQTRDSFKEQLKFQIIIEKLYVKDAAVSTEEIKKFIEENKDQLQSSDSAAQEKEAKEAIQQNKLSKLFAEKFQQLKQNAQVKIF